MTSFYRTTTYLPRRQTTRIALLVSITALMLSVQPLLATEAASIDGHWRLDNDATVAVQPEDARKSNFGFGRVKPSITVGGVPIPLPGGEQTQDLGQPKDPEELHCGILTIATTAKAVELTYDGDASAKWRSGDFRGMTTRWSRSRLTNRYQTMSRKVNKRFELRSDGMLEVTIVIKPKSGKKVTYKRVFQRFDPASEPVADEPQAAAT
ncbi:MAG: hypothetical protein NXH85_10425 [Pseudomonadaceae bacterium]|nr:hypothetical protein [Pseudomonadaceae bacterium]